jgi:hypothetical protein
MAVLGGRAVLLWPPSSGWPLNRMLWCRPGAGRAAVVLWYCGAMVLWSVLWYRGTVVLWVTGLDLQGCFLGVVGMAADAKLRYSHPMGYWNSGPGEGQQNCHGTTAVLVMNEGQGGRILGAIC